MNSEFVRAKKTGRIIGILIGLGIGALASGALVGASAGAAVVVYRMIVRSAR